MNDAALWTARWTRKLLDFLFWIRLRAASPGCRNLLRTSARKGATGTEPRIRTVRQLAAAAGDGPLGFAGSPGQLETSLNSGYTVGPCNSYLEGPTLILSEPAARASRLWICLVRRRSRRKERLRSLLLTTAEPRFPTLAAHSGSPTSETRSRLRLSPISTPGESALSETALEWREASLDGRTRGNQQGAHRQPW
jgi:hypothetical protein